MQVKHKQTNSIYATGKQMRKKCNKKAKCLEQGKNPIQPGELKWSQVWGHTPVLLHKLAGDKLFSQL